MSHPISPTKQPEPEGYEVLVRGHLDPRWADRLGASTLTLNDDGTTVLAGIAGDQAALHGLLQRVRDLGLTLVSVTRVNAGLPSNTTSPPTTKPRNSK